MGNNPVNFNDPTGHFECNDPYGCDGPDDDNADSGVVIGGGGGGGGGNHDDDEDEDLEEELVLVDDANDFLGYLVEHWAAHPKGTIAVLLPRELGSVYYKYKISLSPQMVKLLARISSVSTWLSFFFQAAPAQIENFSDWSNLSGSNVIADLLIDGAIFGISLGVGALVFAAGTSATVGLGAPVAAGLAVVAGAATSAALNSLVVNFNIRSNVTDVIAVSQSSSPDQSLAVPAPIAPIYPPNVITTPFPYGY